MTLRFMRAVLVGILYVGFAFAGDTFAQQASITSIVGRVTDPSGAALPGASVTAVEDGTQQTYTGKTNEEGLYSFPFVRIGTYTITATAAGFRHYGASRCAGAGQPGGPRQPGP